MLLSGLLVNTNIVPIALKKKKIIIAEQFRNAIFDLKKLIILCFFFSYKNCYIGV